MSGKYMVVVAPKRSLRTFFIRWVQAIAILGGFASWLLLMGLGDKHP